MQWEHLTAPNFAKAVEETGVCILAAGCVEKHGEHLPLGTDFINSHRLACLAAEKEPAVVFPPFYFAQIYEARCFPGCVTLSPRLLIELWTSVLDEIGRNGFKKIIILNGHGGNTHLLNFLAQSSLWEEKPYHLYLPQGTLVTEAAANQIWETTEDGHAGERETSVCLATCPEAVRMDDLPEARGTSQKRLDHLPPVYNGIWWYARYPDHYAGDGRTATANKGIRAHEAMAEGLAAFIAAVKADEVIPALTREFFERERMLRM